MSPKRALSPSQTESPASSTPTKKSNGVPGTKARIPREARIALAQDIILQGVAAVNVHDMAQKTGLTSQQIRSQLVDNRNNLRKQLLELIKSLP